MAESSSVSSFTQDATIAAAVAAALYQMGITSALSATPRQEPGSVKIQSPTLLHIDNYALWWLEAQIHLNNAGVWTVVNGSEAQPIADDPHDNWKRKNNQVRALLIQLVTDKYKGIVSNYKSSKEAWDLLENTLDHKSVTSMIHPVSVVFDFKKDSSTSWNEHITQFETHFTTVTTKLSTVTSTDKEWQRGLKQSFADQEFKAHLLLCTLPASYNAVVENLHSKSDLTYSETCTRILELSSESITDGGALLSYQKKIQKKKSQDKRASSKPTTATWQGIPSFDECSYCQKCNLPSKNHKHNKCSVLKKALEEKKATFSGTAKISQALDISSGFALVSSATPSTPSTQSINLGCFLLSLTSTSQEIQLQCQQALKQVIVKYYKLLTREWSS